MRASKCWHRAGRNSEGFRVQNRSRFEFGPLSYCICLGRETDGRFFGVPPAWTWRSDSYWFAEYTPSATGESCIPVLNAIALNVLPYTVRASPFGPFIMCGPVGVGGVPSSVQLKEAPNVFVSIVTLMSCPAGPVLLDGSSVGVAHCVTASFFSQADRNVSAMPAQIMLVSIFMCFLSLCEQAFHSRFNPAGRGSGGALEWPNGLSARDIVLTLERQCQ